MDAPRPVNVGRTPAQVEGDGAQRRSCRIAPLGEDARASNGGGKRVDAHRRAMKTRANGMNRPRDGEPKPGNMTSACAGSPTGTGRRCSIVADGRGPCGPGPGIKAVLGPAPGPILRNMERNSSPTLGGKGRFQVRGGRLGRTGGRAPAAGWRCGRGGRDRGDPGHDLGPNTWAVTAARNERRRPTAGAARCGPPEADEG